MSRRGQGHVFQPTWTRDGKRHRSKVWHAAWSENGKRYRESTGCESKTEAVAYLNRRLAERAEPRANMTLGEMRDRLLARYERDGNRSTDRVEQATAHLIDFFGEGRKASDITEAWVDEYVEHRLQEGAANATVNRELAALKRCYKLIRLPHPVPEMLKEADPRQGFFEAQDFADVLAELPDEIKPVALLGYYTGMRRSEILGLRWADVDFESGFLRLPVGSTKNREGRSIPLFPQVRELLEEQRRQARICERENRRLVTHVCFRYGSGTQIKDIRGAWAGACERAKVDRLFHDLRRTAVRNMVLAGLSTHEAMRISGHKTASVFARYAILNDPRAMRAAGERLGSHLGELPERSKQTTSIGRRTA